jgi:ABC-type branched-subunit amino acid transport system substrate-binding protein
MITSTHPRGARPLLLAAMMIAGLSQAAAQQTGITDTTIKLGTQAPMSGPVAMIGMVAEGMDMRFKAANAGGGVKMGDGKTRTVDLVIMDDANEPPRTVTNARRMIEQMGVFAIVGAVGTPQNQAIKAYLAQKKIPNIFIYSGIYEWGDEKLNPWSTMLVPSFTTEAAIYARYLEEHKPEAKVAVLYINTDFGTNFLDGFKAAIKGTKITLVAAQSTANTDPTVDTQLTNLKAAGADTILVAAAPKAAAQAIRFGAETGWKPLTFVTYAASSVIALKAAGFENSKGVLTGQFVKPVGSPDFANDPGVKQYLADYERFKPRFDKNDSLAQMGYLMADAVVKVLERMKEPTRESMLATARNMKNIELGLLYPGIKLNTGPGDQFPIEAMQLFEFDGQAYRPVGKLIDYEGHTPKLELQN